MHPYQRSKASFIQTRNCDLLKAINAHVLLLNPVRFFHWVLSPQAKSRFYFPVSWSFPCWSWTRDFLFESTLTSRNHRPELLKGLFERQKQNYALFVCLRLLKKNIFLCEAMRSALSQVIVKRWGGAVSVLCAFSDSGSSGGGWGGRTNCPLEVSDIVGHLDLKSWVRNLSQQKRLCGRIVPADGSCHIKGGFWPLKIGIACVDGMTPCFNHVSHLCGFSAFLHTTSPALPSSNQIKRW